MAVTGVRFDTPTPLPSPQAFDIRLGQATPVPEPGPAPTQAHDAKGTNSADLQKDSTFQGLDASTRQQALGSVERHRLDAGAVDDTVSLVKSPGFQNARRGVQRALLAAQDHHAGDRLFSKSLEKLAGDPAFARLNEQQQTAAVRAFDDIAGREVYKGKEGVLYGWVGGKKVSDADKQHILDNLARIVTSPGFAAIPQDAQRTALDSFAHHATDDHAINSMVSLMNSSGFRAADGAVQKELLTALDHHATDDIFRDGLQNLAGDGGFAARPQNERIGAVRNLDQFASSEIYQGSAATFLTQALRGASSLALSGASLGRGAKPVSDADKRLLLEALRIDPSITVGSLDGRGNVSAAELKLQADAHVAVRSDPAANAAFDKLIKSGDFKSLGSDTRIAVLSQASNYPDSRSIGNLERLTGRQWFRGASLGDQQRSAKIVAFASQDTTANTTITNNALHFILTNSHLTLRWDHIGSAPGTVTYGNQREDRFLGSGFLWTTGTTITLNRDFIPDGNGSLAGNINARQISEDTLAHEVNHDLNHDKVGKSYRYFMGEYRAWYVGFEAAHGRPPTQEECFHHAQFLVTSTSGAYAKIAAAFNDTGSAESNQIVGFMARMIGADPAHATNVSVLHPPLGSLSTTGVGLAPEPANANDPNNVDDHN
jgi:hypothetical protein